MGCFRKEAVTSNQVNYRFGHEITFFITRPSTETPSMRRFAFENVADANGPCETGLIAQHPFPHGLKDSSRINVLACTITTKCIAPSVVHEHRSSALPLFKKCVAASRVIRLKFRVA